MGGCAHPRDGGEGVGVDEGFKEADLRDCEGGGAGADAESALWGRLGGVSFIGGGGSGACRYGGVGSIGGGFGGHGGGWHDVVEDNG